MLTQVPHLPAASANALTGTRTLGAAPRPGKAAHRRAANEPHAHNDWRSPAGGAGNGNGNRRRRLGRSASLIRWPGAIRNGLRDHAGLKRSPLVSNREHVPVPSSHPQKIARPGVSNFGRTRRTSASASPVAACIGNLLLAASPSVCCRVGSPGAQARRDRRGRQLHRAYGRAHPLRAVVVAGQVLVGPHPCLSGEPGALHRDRKLAIRGTRGHSVDRRCTVGA
jgi:hypothetical protein